jgi:arylsulfatase A-like enzyme
MRAMRALGKLEDGPFFLTVFFSAAHFPYAAAFPHYRRFTDPAYRGRFKYHKPVGLASETDLDVADVRQIRGLYDGAVSAIDGAIGAIVRELESRKLRERTVIVITADHGETLFEQGRWHGHGDHLFGDESTHVPLVVVDPRQPGRVVPTIVRDVDLAATLYALTGVAAPEDLDGRSLRPAIEGQPLAPALAYAETELWMGDTPGVPAALRMPVPPVTRMLELDTQHGNEIVLRRDVRALTTMARHRMIRDERFKLLYMPTRERAEYRLFDTQTDPDETIDVSATLPAEVERLKRELWSFVLADKALIRRGEYLVPSEP